MGRVLEQTQGYIPFPSGLYTLQWESIEERTSEREGFEGRTFLLHTFKVLTGPESNGRDFTQISSTTFSPRSKIYGWAQAAFGGDIPENYHLDLDHLLGRQVQAQVSESDGRNTIDSMVGVTNATPPPWLTSTPVAAMVGATEPQGPGFDEPPSAL